MVKPFDVLKEALRLKEERPELDIIFWACGDEMCDPYDNPYTAQSPVSVSVDSGWFGPSGEMWRDESDAIDEFRDGCPDSMTDEEADAFAEQEFAKVKIEAICIRLRAWVKGGA